MTILELIKLIKIDFTQGVVIRGDGAVLDYPFEIKPKDFLDYSKQDFKSKDRRGNINALTNAKRAIDCQTDKVFYSIGLDPNDFPKAIEEFVLKSKNSPVKKDLPVKLKFLQAMGFAPAEIIAKTRLLRNKLEHFYEEPSKEEVSNAIELAELFILATGSKSKTVWDFSITDDDKKSKIDGHLHVSFNNKKSLFNLQRSYTGKKIQIKSTTVEFYHFLKIATSFDYDEDVQDSVIDLVDLIGHPIPKNNIKIRTDE